MPVENNSASCKSEDKDKGVHKANRVFKRV